MILLDVYKKHNKPTIICLGRFDGLHIGHQALIEDAKKIKNNCGIDCDVCVFSFFKSEPISRLNTIFTQKETILEIENTKADAIIYAYETPEFFNTAANEKELQTLVSHPRCTHAECPHSYGRYQSTHYR